MFQDFEKDMLFCGATRLHFKVEETNFVILKLRIRAGPAIDFASRNVDSTHKGYIFREKN